MASRTTEFKVGLTVIIALAALGWGIVWVKGYRYGQEVTQYRVSFPNVGALSAGDPVAVNGVTKGKVTAVELERGKVVVSVELDKKIDLRSDASFTVKNLGLMGERFIEIFPGVAEIPYDHEQVAVGQFDSGLPEVMGMMGEMIGEVRGLVSIISSTVENAPGAVRRADSTVIDLREAARTLSSLLTENRQRFESAAIDMAATAKSIRHSVDSRTEQVDSTLDRMASASQSMLSAAARFDTLSGQLRTLADELQSGQGTLGALMKDPSLYDDLKRAASEVDALVADIRANPQKYVKVDFSIF